MSDIIKFERKPQLTEHFRTLIYTPDCPELAAEIAKADEMVSYDINTMSVDELRNGLRCFIVLDRREHLRHITEKRVLQDQNVKHRSDKSELLDSLKSLIKMHGHRDPISDKLLPSDLQPDPEIGEAMRLVVSAGGAV